MSASVTENRLFEVASRKKYRFSTAHGQVSVEDLWQMPLLSRDDFNLNNVAKALNAQIKASGEESFVKVKTTEDTDLSNKFEIVKYIIEVLMAEKEAAASAAEKRAEKARLIDLLARKENEALESLTPEEIKVKIAALEA